MRLLSPLLLFVGTAAALRMPAFDDPLLGKLIVSKRKFPFLTLEHSPDMAHVYPTDQQLQEIKKVVGGHKQFETRMRRALDEAPTDDLPADPNAAFAWFSGFQKFLGKFLKFEFSYEVLNSTLIDPGSLPFDKIASDAYFKAIVIDREQLKPYLEQEFNPRMRGLAAGEKPWLPAEKLIQEMRECSYVKYGSASDEDFKFDKDVGGVMVYYKVTCMRVQDNYYIGLSTYDNKFTLHKMEHEDTIQKGFSLFGGLFNNKRTEKKRWFEARYITLDDLKKLLNYIMNDFAERIRMEYGQYITTLEAPPAPI